MRDHPRFEFVLRRHQQPDARGQARPARSDQVVHFAAESHVARSIADERDLLPDRRHGHAGRRERRAWRTQQKLERFVHISTSEVYGSAVREPMDEDHPLLPSSPYAAAKAGADRLVDAYVRTYDLPAVIVRPFNNYGPRQHLEKCVPRFVTSTLLGEPLELHGGGRPRATGSSSSDCVAGDARVPSKRRSRRVRGQVINLGTGNGDVGRRDRRRDPANSPDARRSSAVPSATGPARCELAHRRHDARARTRSAGPRRRRADGRARPTYRVVPRQPRVVGRPAVDAPREGEAPRRDGREPLTAARGADAGPALDSTPTVVPGDQRRTSVSSTTSPGSRRRP